MEILRLIFNPAVVWVFIPIIAIGGKYYAEIRKAKYQALAKQGLSDEDKQILKELALQNSNLNERVESLEEIITSMDKELIALGKQQQSENQQQRVKEIADKMKG